MARGGVRAHGARGGTRGCSRRGAAVAALVHRPPHPPGAARWPGSASPARPPPSRSSSTTCASTPPCAPNGDLLVTEQRAFAFDGAFHFVYWELDAGGAGDIEVLGVDGPDGPLERSTRRSRIRLPGRPRPRGPRAWWRTTRWARPTRSRCGTGRSARPSGSTTPPSSTGSSSATAGARRPARVDVGRHAAQRREEGPGARLGTRSAERLGRHRARRHGALHRPRTCPRRRSSRAASCSRRRRSPRLPVIDQEELPAALAEEKQWADEANALRRHVIAEREAAAWRKAAWRVTGIVAPALLVVAARRPVLRQGPRLPARAAAAGCPSTFPTTCRRRWSRCSGTAGTWSAAPSRPRCSTSSSAASSPSSR